MNCNLRAKVVSLLTLMNSYRRKPPDKIGMVKYLPPVCRILEYGAKRYSIEGWSLTQIGFFTKPSKVIREQNSDPVDCRSKSPCTGIFEA